MSSAGVIHAAFVEPHSGRYRAARRLSAAPASGPSKPLIAHGVRSSTGAREGTLPVTSQVGNASAEPWCPATVRHVHACPSAQARARGAVRLDVGEAHREGHPATVTRLITPVDFRRERCGRAARIASPEPVEGPEQLTDDGCRRHRESRPETPTHTRDPPPKTSARMLRK